MGLKQAYLTDKARILRPSPTIDKGVVSHQGTVIANVASSMMNFSSDYEPHGDWIAARLRPVSGNLERDLSQGQVKLPYTYELVLYAEDESGNEVCPVESDRFEITVNRNGKMTDSVVGFKITGPINEVRKRTRVVSYVVGVVQEAEL